LDQAERKLREHLIATGVDSVETFKEVTGRIEAIRDIKILRYVRCRDGSAKVFEAAASRLRVLTRQCLNLSSDCGVVAEHVAWRSM
jgi:hypothetical protein